LCENYLVAVKNNLAAAAAAAAAAKINKWL